jgi:hypothetical protein
LVEESSDGHLIKIKFGRELEQERLSMFAELKTRKLPTGWVGRPQCEFAARTAFLREAAA